MKSLLSLLALWAKAFLVFAAIVFVVATVQQMDEIDVGTTVWSPR